MIGLLAVFSKKSFQYVILPNPSLSHISLCIKVNLFNSNFHHALFCTSILQNRIRSSKISCPTSATAVTLKNGRRKVPGSNPGRACRPSRAEFSVVFSETRVNTGYDPLERPPRRALDL